MSRRVAATAPPTSESADDLVWMRGLVRGVLALVVLGFAPSLYDPFHAFKAIVLRGGGLALLAVVLVDALIRRAQAARASRPGPGAARAFEVSVVAWCAATSLSAMLAQSPRLAISGEVTQREGVLTAFALAGIAAAVRRSHTTVAHAARTLVVLGVCAALAAAYALAQAAGADPIAWANPAVYRAAGERAVRAASTFGNPNLLGATLAAAFASSCAWQIRRGGVLPAGLALIGGLGVAVTLSRGAAFAALGAATAGGLLAWFVAPAPRRRAARALVAATAAAGAIVAAVRIGPWTARLAEDEAGPAGSTNARREIARAALELWRAHPIAGVGPDGFGLAFPRVQPESYWRDEWIGMPVHAHSVPLQVLATLGALGALAGLAWLTVVARAVVDRWRTRPAEHARADLGVVLATALIACVLAGALNPLGLAGAAVFVALSAMAVVVADRRDGVLPRIGAPAWAVGAMLLLAMIPAAVHEWRALHAASLARGALEQRLVATDAAGGELVRRAVIAADEAVRHAPGEDEFWRLAADAELESSRGAWARDALQEAEAASRRAQRAAARAMELEPSRASNVLRDALAWAALARAERRAGRADSASTHHARARDAFGRAVHLAPRDALVRVAEARAALEAWEADEARVAAAAIVAAYPEAATGHALVAAAALAARDAGAARVALRHALAARWEVEDSTQHAVARRMLAQLDAAAEGVSAPR